MTITMGKHTPDSLKNAKSPFLESLVIPVFMNTKEKTKVDIDKITTENGIVTKLGQKEVTKSSFLVEDDSHVRMYHENNGTDLRPFYAKLSKEGRAMLEYIMFHCLREDKLCFYLDNKDFMAKYEVKSHTTVWSSKKDLINNNFISPTSCRDWYWINPRFVFKGKRSLMPEMKDNLKIRY